MYILLVPIQKELKFTDLQLAALGAFAFVIFYTLLGIPFGRRARSRSVRRRGSRSPRPAAIIALRETRSASRTLGPAALSLIGDYFPPLLGDLPLPPHGWRRRGDASARR
ncbi:MAG TPA: hypothetical protein VND45_03975 [Thermoanaerobaculia bacterium]|jgi:hypothetical protein|nr:hypothetical protein [Thermoanaerobaculia bacterium]